MWCDVRRCDLMRCDCLCCVMSRDAMRCHVMCAHVLSYHLLCPAMGWNLRCHSVRSHCVFELVIQSTILYYKALLCTTKYYSSTTLYYKVVLEYYSSTSLYYKVLLHYYPVLHSTTPVLLCTTKYYSSTTLYYKVLLQYYSSTTLYYKVLLHYYPLLHSTTPVLLCTTQYYNVLLQYYSVLQSTTPVLLCTTQYYNVLLQYYTVLQSSIHDWSLTHMNRHLHDWCPMMTPLGSTAPCRGGTVCKTFQQGSKQVGGYWQAILIGFDSNKLHEGMVKSVSHWHGPDPASNWALTSPTFDQTPLIQRFQRRKFCSLLLPVSRKQQSLRTIWDIVFFQTWSVGVQDFCG